MSRDIVPTCLGTSFHLKSRVGSERELSDQLTMLGQHPNAEIGNEHEDPGPRTFGSLEAAQVELDAWVADYNTMRPHQALEMATPADRFRLAPLAKDQASIPVDGAEDLPGQWVLRRVGSNGVASVDNQQFSVGNAFKGDLVDVFVDETTIQVWSKNHLIKTVARVRSGPVRKIRADGLIVQPQPKTPRQASAGT